MRRLARLLDTRLALRSAALTLLAVALLGIASLIAAVYVSEHRERQREHARLAELLDTVERTVQIACYLDNEELATEVAGGLLSNSTIGRVRIFIGERLFFDRVASPGTAGQPITRSIASPFIPGEEVCQLQLVPNADEIRRSALEASLFTGLILLLQLLALGVVVVVVVLRQVTRPIAAVSRELVNLTPESGHKVKVPRGNERDELGKLVKAANGMIDRLVASLQGERELRQRREIEERRFRAIFENVETGIFELDAEGRLLAANPAFLRMFGLGQEVNLVSQQVFLQDLAGAAQIHLEELLPHLQSDAGPRSLEIHLDERDRPRWISLLLNRFEQGRFQGVVNDVTERQLATREAERMAVTDPLTGLGNRRGLMRRLNAATRVLASDSDYQCTLILLGLDRFKAANDRFGHAVGDAVLQHVGKLLLELVRKADYVARPGGDEFVVLLDGWVERENVERILSRFLSRVNQPIHLEEDVIVNIGASLGVAVLGRDARDETILLKLADAAMYRAKHAGRNQFCFHQSDSAD